MKKILQTILENIENETISTGEIVFLQSRAGKAAIKRHYRDNATLCEWAGIKESTFINWNK